ASNSGYARWPTGARQCTAEMDWRRYEHAALPLARAELPRRCTRWWPDLQRDESVGRLLRRAWRDRVSTGHRPPHRWHRRRYPCSQRDARVDRAVLPFAPADSRALGIRRELREASGSAVDLWPLAAVCRHRARQSAAPVDRRTQPVPLVEGTQHRSRDDARNVQFPRRGARAAAVRSQPRDSGHADSLIRNRWERESLETCGALLTRGAAPLLHPVCRTCGAHARAHNEPASPQRVSRAERRARWGTEDAPV